MNLKTISDQVLLQHTKRLIENERELLIQILHHLKEIDARRLFLEIGFSSLWAYCTKELGYSEGAAQRRIEAMRAMRDVPAIEEKIESGVLTLSNLAKAQTVIRREKISADEKLEIFLALENKSQTEAEKILAAKFPVLAQERIRPLNAEQTEIKIVASHELVAKLEKIKSLFSHKNANASWAETIEMMADLVIAKKDPEAKKLPPLRRYSDGEACGVTAQTRAEVWRAAHGKCEYVDPQSGRRCEGRHKLEIEHVMPKAFGGSNARANLRLYCRAHNMMAARQATLAV